MNEEMIDLFQATDDIPKQIEELSKKINYKTITANELRDTFEAVLDIQRSNKRS